MFWQVYLTTKHSVTVIGIICQVMFLFYEVENRADVPVNALLTYFLFGISVFAIVSII